MNRCGSRAGEWAFRRVPANDSAGHSATVSGSLETLYGMVDAEISQNDTLSGTVVDIRKKLKTKAFNI